MRRELREQMGRSERGVEEIRGGMEMWKMPQAAAIGDNYHMQSRGYKALHFGALLLSQPTEEPPPSALRREQGLDPSAGRRSVQDCSGDRKRL